MVFRVDFGDRRVGMEERHKGAYNRKYVSEDGQLVYSLPLLDDDVEVPVRDSEDLVKYQRTLLRNVRALQEEGFKVPETALSIGSYGGEKYPFIVSEYRDELANGEEEIINRFSGRQRDESLPLKASRAIDSMLENDGGTSIQELLEEGELVYANGDPGKELGNYGFELLHPDHIWILDIGEVPPDLPDYSPYDAPEQMWEETGIADAAETIMQQSGMENRDVSGDLLLNGRT
ncbi:MAG: hypothetical protein ABEJ91_01270 [Candidatus Nanohaloarchaea archaeon]